MDNTQSGKLRKARNSFAAALAIAATAAIVGAPAGAQDRLTMTPVDPTAYKQCTEAGTTYMPGIKKWSCQHCLAVPILGVVCGETFIEYGHFWEP